ERGAPASPETLLSGDWAAAVPAEKHPARAVPAPVKEPPPPPPSEPDLALKATPASPQPEEEDDDGPAPGDDASERTSPILALGLRPRACSPEPEAEEPSAPAAAPPRPTSTVAEHPPELPTRSRDGKVKLDIPSDAEFNGELLRRVRESYGLSLQQVAERTRITRIHLENVEADRYDRLPATVYLRGILVNLAP